MRRGRVNRRNKNMMSRHKSNIGRVNRSNKKSGVNKRNKNKANKRKNITNNRMNNKPQTPKTTPRNKRKHPLPLFLQQTEKGTRTSQ